MKIIHCADVHLGSKMEARLPKAKSEERKTEVRQTFSRMVEYAKAEGVRVILLSGDVFDSERPLKRDKEYFYKTVKSCPEIDFLYLRGNHDEKESYTEELENLKTFSEAWTGYDYGDVHICGLELTKGNAASLYSSLRLEKGRKNIVMLHGQIAPSAGAGKINLNKLADKYIDYLALGHIHSYEEKPLDDRGRYAYSGCLEGRGFDETGEKGFVLLEIGERIESKFVPFAKRTIEEISVDVSDADGWFETKEKVKNTVKFDKKNMYRIELVGDVGFEEDKLAKVVEEELQTLCYFVSVKDKTLLRIDAEKYKGDVSIRGEFVRSILARTDWTEEKKRQVIALGLKALKGDEVD